MHIPDPAHLVTIFAVVAVLLALFWPRGAGAEPERRGLLGATAVLIALPALGVSLALTRHQEAETAKKAQEQSDQMADLGRDLTFYRGQAASLSAQVGELSKKASESQKSCAEQARKFCLALQGATKKIGDYETLQDGRISLSLQEPYVTFDTNVALLTEVDKENLSKLAGILSWPITLGSLENITVVGHTDITGTPKRNAELSLERAKAVRLYLISAGVPEGLLGPPEGKGERQPFTTHSDQPQSEIVRLNAPALMAKNRRVEVLIRKRPGPTGALSCD